MTAIARRYEISARRASRVERNLCLYVIIITFELAGIYTDPWSLIIAGFHKFAKDGC